MLGPTEYTPINHHQNRKHFLKVLLNSTPELSLKNQQPSLRSAESNAALKRAEHSRSKAAALLSLKSRLEYAKWKVEKGWTGIPFEQVCDMYEKEKGMTSSGKARPSPPDRFENMSRKEYEGEEEQAAMSLMSLTHHITR
jgi:hypothetical protein